MSYENNYIKSFCGRQSRAISNDDESFLKSLFSKNIFNISTLDLIDQEKIKDFNVIFEIGFGDGAFIKNYFEEYILKDPEKIKNAFYIGSDIYKKGALNIIHYFKQINFHNYIIFLDDARCLLDKINGKIDNIFLLYPDPWPKTKHAKRRIFSYDFLKTCNKALNKNGNLIVATDHYEYYIYIDNIINDSASMLYFKKNEFDINLKPLISKNTYAVKALYSKTMYMFNLKKNDAK